MTTKTFEIRERLKRRIEMLPTETIKQVCVKCMTDYRDGVNTVMEMSLDTLQGRLSKGEFIAFCKELEV